MPSRHRLIIAGLLCAGLGGCSLPRGAALQSEVLRAESAKDPGFAVYPLERAMLGRVAAWPATGDVAPRKWPRHTAGENGQIVAVGDTAEITIWDSDANSLLASHENKSVQLQTMLVSTAGTVFVPYIGQVRIAGMSPGHARETVQGRLEALIPSAQVQINFRPGPMNSVSLVGGVRQPGNFALATRSETVLDLISRGGGVPETMENPQVRLVRGNDYYAISLERLYADPMLDATLRGGDKVFVEADKRVFLSLGAAGRETQIPFNRDRLSALDAVTLAGGLTDGRADPKGILILREYPAGSVSPDGITGPEDTRVIFTLDLTTADGLFSAGRFDIMPRDLVLATESPVGSTQTIIGLLGASVGVAVNANKL